MIVYYKIHLDDIGWIDNWRLEPIDFEGIFDWMDCSKPVSEVNAFELMGFGKEISKELQLCFNKLSDVLQDALVDFTSAIAPTIEPVSKWFTEVHEWWYGEDDRHFDGVYSKPKMLEYYKKQPNICNLNNQIRKVRNLL